MSTASPQRPWEGLNQPPAPASPGQHARSRGWVRPGLQVQGSHRLLGAHCTSIISFFIYWLQLCNYLYKRNHRTAGGVFLGGEATAHCGLKSSCFFCSSVTNRHPHFFPLRKTLLPHPRYFPRKKPLASCAHPVPGLGRCPGAGGGGAGWERCKAIASTVTAPGEVRESSGG